MDSARSEWTDVQRTRILVMLPVCRNVRGRLRRESGRWCLGGESEHPQRALNAMQTAGPVD